jgi:hypothetical protein
MRWIVSLSIALLIIGVLWALVTVTINTHGLPIYIAAFFAVWAVIFSTWGQ